jgi:ribonuclease III
MADGNPVQPPVSENRVMKDLQTRIGYHFKNEALLKQALSHISMSGAKDSYERMEFLGDRILSFVIADLLYKTFPEEKEGAMAKRHSALVKQATLEKVALNISLPDYILLSGKNLHKRPTGSILSDVIEAIICALYMDGGLEAAMHFIRAQWQDFLLQDLALLEDAKSALQEWTQARGIPLPEYKLVGQSGPDHEPVFTVEASVKGFDPQQASAYAKQAAEKMAAFALLEKVRAKNG